MVRNADRCVRPASKSIYLSLQPIRHSLKTAPNEKLEKLQKKQIDGNECMHEQPIKVALICGSLRQGSFNSAIARALIDIAPSSMSFRWLEGMREIPHYDADIQSKGFPTTVLDWADSIGYSNAVLFITPEYNFSIPGTLKNALDWLSRLRPAPFSGKPVAIQTASTGMLGGARAQYHLRQVLLYLDAQVLNKPEIMVADVGSKISSKGLLTDAITRQLIGEQLIALEKMVRKLSPSR